MLDGVTNEFDVISYAELFPDSCMKRADGLDAEGELGGNFLEGFAGDEVVHDLELTVGEGLMGWTSIAQEIGDELLGELLTDVLAAGEYGPDGLNEIFRSGLLVEVAASTGFEDAEGHLFFRCAAEDQDGDAGVVLANFSKNFQAAPPRHEYIKHDDVPGPVAEGFEGFASGARLAELGVGEFLREDLLESLAEKGMVVG
jgi:hypothetical protein